MSKFNPAKWMWALVVGLVPACVTLVVTLAAALPWGVPGQVSFLLPFLTLGVIFYWVVVRPKQLPVWFAFLLGLVTDLLTNGPFGFWSLNFVVGHSLAILFKPGKREARWLFSWVLYALVLVLIGGLGWFVASLYFFQIVDWVPVAYSAVWAFAAYPLISFFLHFFESVTRTPVPRARHMEARPGGT